MMASVTELKCTKCGAPLTSRQCAYCKAVFSFDLHDGALSAVLSGGIEIPYYQTPEFKAAVIAIEKALAPLGVQFERITDHEFIDIVTVRPMIEKQWTGGFFRGKREDVEVKKKVEMGRIWLHGWTGQRWENGDKIIFCYQRDTSYSQTGKPFEFFVKIAEAIRTATGRAVKIQ